MPLRRQTQLDGRNRHIHHDPAAIETTIVTSEPAAETEARLDAVILTCAIGDWVKVAVLIARITDAARAEALEVSPQGIAARIYALVDAHRLQVKGNVRRWRAGEVRNAAAAVPAECAKLADMKAKDDCVKKAQAAAGRAAGTTTGSTTKN